MKFFTASYPKRFLSRPHSAKFPAPDVLSNHLVVTPLPITTPSQKRIRHRMSLALLYQFKSLSLMVIRTFHNSVFSHPRKTGFSNFWHICTKKFNLHATSFRLIRDFAWGQPCMDQLALCLHQKFIPIYPFILRNNPKEKLSFHIKGGKDTLQKLG